MTRRWRIAVVPLNSLSETNGTPPEVTIQLMRLLFARCQPVIDMAATTADMTNDFSGYDTQKGEVLERLLSPCAM